MHTVTLQIRLKFSVSVFFVHFCDSRFYKIPLQSLEWNAQGTKKNYEKVEAQVLRYFCDVTVCFFCINLKTAVLLLLSSIKSSYRYLYYYIFIWEFFPVYLYKYINSIYDRLSILSLCCHNLLYIFVTSTPRSIVCNIINCSCVWHHHVV